MKISVDRRIVSYVDVLILVAFPEQAWLVNPILFLISSVERYKARLSLFVLFCRSRGSVEPISSKGSVRKGCLKGIISRSHFEITFIKGIEVVKVSIVSITIRSVLGM